MSIEGGIVGIFCLFGVGIFALALAIGVVREKLRAGLFTSATLVVGDGISVDEPAVDKPVDPRLAPLLARPWTRAILALARVDIRTPSARVAPGERLDLRLALRLGRAIQPSAVEWELVGEEVAISRGGTRNSTYTNTFERLQVEAPPQGEWRAGTRVELSGEITVPATAPPSFSTANHSIRWSALARVRLPRLPDLELSQGVAVMVPEVAPGDASGRTRQALEQGGLRGELTLDLPSDGGIPVAHPRSKLVGSLRLQVVNSIEGRQTSVRLVRLLHGSGTPEEAVHEEMFIREGELAAGQSLSAEVDWIVPPTNELTFQGRHVKCDWMVDVKVDRPGFDVHLRFPLNVVGA